MITDGSVSPSNATIDYGSSYEITCNTDFKIAGPSVMTCGGADGHFYLTPTCQGPCDKPSISEGIVSPSDPTIDYGSSYEITCTAGFRIVGSATMTCSADGNFDQMPTCHAGKSSSKPADATLLKLNI